MAPAVTQPPANATPDGNVTITDPATIVNMYSVIANAKKGDTTITYNPGNVGSLDFIVAPGDLIMLYQAQGATVDSSSDSAAFGAVTALNSSGFFEFAVVKTFDGNAGKITIDSACGGLRNDYSNAGGAQILRVPQYDTLTINGGELPGSIVPEPWYPFDGGFGGFGGIVAVRAKQIVVNGQIQASGFGFTGAFNGVNNSVVGADVVTYRGGTNIGAQKGESIAGSPSILSPTILNGRGAIANGGGGGNAYKAGGGGGGGAGDIALWTGQGQMGTGVVGAQAWTLDPVFVLTGMLATSTGGGRGGYSHALVANNPISVGPADAKWGGNLRRERGGLGGRPLPHDPTSRLFFGGGGGAGDAINGGSFGGTGGTGGGIVYLMANSISGTGFIAADGTPGQPPAGPNFTAAAGGGGGAGAVILNAVNITGVTVSADGGRGGSQPATPPAVVAVAPEADGPGGGGGGGFIAVPAGVTITRHANGGLGGISLSGLITQFPTNGASAGARGLDMFQLPQGLGTDPICTPSDVSVTVDDGVTKILPNDTLTYTVKVKNNGPDFAVQGVQVTSTGTPPIIQGWTCAANANGGAGLASCSAAQGSGEINARVSLPVGGEATFTVTSKVPGSQLGTVEYAVTAQVPSGDSNPANNTATDTDMVDLLADLAVTATVKESPVHRTLPATYTVKASNNGPKDAVNVKLDITLPGGARLSQPPVLSGWQCTAIEPLVNCTRQALTSGESDAVEVSIIPDINANTAAISAVVSSDRPDPDMTNNTATAQVDIDMVRPSEAGGGFSCSAAGGRDATGGGGALLVALGLLLSAGLLRSRRRQAAVAAAVAATLGGVGAAEAQQVNQGFQVNRYEPSAAGEFSFWVQHPWYSGIGRYFAAGLTFNYGHNPLVRGLRDPNGGFVQTDSLIEHQLLGHVDLAGSFLDRVLVTLSLPVTLLESGKATDGIAPLSGVAVGDPRLGVFVRLFGQPYSGPISMSLGANVWFPINSFTGSMPSLGTTGGTNARAFADQIGESGWRVMPKIILGGLAFKHLLWSFEGAYYYRPDASIGGLAAGQGNTIGSQLTLGAALSYADMERRFSVGPEVLLSTVLSGGNIASYGSNAFQQSFTGLELLLGAHYNIARIFQVGLGGGVGLMREPGTPDGRVLLRLAYAPMGKKAPVVLDRDHDGINDILDACPDEAGPPSKDPGLNGCPPPKDRDGDGVVDSADLCPDEAKGENPDPKKAGCPLRDKDGDGVFDDEDQCPDVAKGEHPDAAKPGCPLVDKDGDGVFDNEDQCPEVAKGDHPDSKKPGCPDKDSDGDGVYDSADQCPTVPTGLYADPQKAGCPAPDRDGDHVPDAVDACPDKAGAPSVDPKKNGCPGLVEVKNNQIVILQQVFFATGKDVILKKSFPLLLAVADVMKSVQQVKKVEVEGHTDNKGKPDLNRDLSDRRAKAVMKFLVDNGVEPGRLQAKGYGPDKPIADNKTNKGRALNRRVDFRILDPAQAETKPGAAADAPKADAPKADAPKADAPKADAPKADEDKTAADDGKADKKGKKGKKDKKDKKDKAPKEKKAKKAKKAKDAG